MSLLLKKCSCFAHRIKLQPLQTISLYLNMQKSASKNMLSEEAGFYQHQPFPLSNVEALRLVLRVSDGTLTSHTAQQEEHNLNY